LFDGLLDVSLEFSVVLKHSGEALTGEFSSSLATVTIHDGEARIKAGTFKVVANHKLHTHKEQRRLGMFILLTSER